MPEASSNQLTVNEALEFLRNAIQRPLFLTVPFLAPHLRWFPGAVYGTLSAHGAAGAGDRRWAEPSENDGSAWDRAPPASIFRAMRSVRARRVLRPDQPHRRPAQPPAEPRDRRDGRQYLIATSDHGEMLGDHYVAQVGSLRVIGPHPVADPSAGVRLAPGAVVEQAVCLRTSCPPSCPWPASPRRRPSKAWICRRLRGEPDGTRPYLHIEHALHHTLPTAGKKYIWLSRMGEKPD